jgi:hypothetical protein
MSHLRSVTVKEETVETFSGQADLQPITRSRCTLLTSDGCFPMNQFIDYQNAYILEVPQMQMSTEIPQCIKKRITNKNRHALDAEPMQVLIPPMLGCKG